MGIFLKFTTAALLLIPLITNATEITQTQVTGTRFKFTAKLDAPLIAGNKVKIDFGKNLVPMTCVETTCNLFRTMNSDVMPTYKIGIYNSKNVLQVAETHTATKSYTKIANDGSELPDSAQLGTNPKDWACTKDSKTGLIWEVKTSDGGLHDMNNSYSWYEPDESKNGGYGGYKNNSYDNQKSICKGSECDTYAFSNAVNNQGLCGAKDWRLPNNEELKGLVVCSYGKYNTLADGEDGYICKDNENALTTTHPTINTTYFPNTKSSRFWSSNASDRYNAWHVNFYHGSNSAYGKHLNYDVRLVRDGQ